MTSNLSFFNGCFDKGRLKSLISWCLINCGEQFTIELVENLKNVGFEYATQAGVSLGIDDLKIPPTKAQLVSDAELQIISAKIEYHKGHLTAVEKFQQLIDTWHRTSETLKQNVIQYFRATDILNPVYMMAFSGARGNVSQVRQLVGMRGLMADPQGQIIDFPIRSNFREGLTLTEYVISCYGARKGLVDTALRTANSGYLTRRLVDVSQHVIVCQFDCGTSRGILLTEMTEGNKVLLPLKSRLLGRVLAETIYTDLGSNKSSLNNEEISGKPINNNLSKKLNLTLQKQKISKNKIVLSTSKQLKELGNHTISPSILIAKKGQEISSVLAEKIVKLKSQVLVRSPLTCEAKSSICQLCYGWSLAHGKLVSLGEAVGVLAAQSIGEPGTQLTMRTFHTGGVFSGDLMTEIRAPFDGTITFIEALQGILIRTPHGRIAFLTKIQGNFYITPTKYSERLKIKDQKQHFKIPASTILFVRQKEVVTEKQLIAEFSSISTQMNQRIQAKHNLNSEMEGQVFFENVFLGVKLGKDDDIIRIARKLGSIWILSGKIYQTMVPTSFFPKSGDLVNSNSVINQISVISPYTGLLQKQKQKKIVSLLKKSSNYKKSTSTLFKNSFLINNKVFSKKLINSKNNLISTNQPASLLFQGEEKISSNFHLQSKAKLRINSFKELQSNYSPIKHSNLISNLNKLKTFKVLRKLDTISPQSKLLLSSTLLALNIKKISYSGLGYFITFWPQNTLELLLQKNLCQTNYLNFIDKTSSLAKSSLKPISFVQLKNCSSLMRCLTFKDNWQFNHKLFNKRKDLSKSDLFFLSTSVKQEVTNSPNLKKVVYLQSFPINYKTKTGGLLFYDSLYFEESRGNIFWVPEENYKFNTKTVVIPTQTHSKKISLSDIKSKFSSNHFKQKWITNTSPIFIKSNSQGKLITFSSNKSGWIGLTINNTLKTTTITQGLKAKKFSNKQANSFVSQKFTKKLLFSGLLYSGEAILNLKQSFLNLYFNISEFSNQTKQSKEQKKSFLLNVENKSKTNDVFSINTTSFFPLHCVSFLPNPDILLKVKNLKSLKKSTLNKKSWNRTNLSQIQLSLLKKERFSNLYKYKFNKTFLTKQKYTKLTLKSPFFNSPVLFATTNSTLSPLQNFDINHLLNTKNSLLSLDQADFTKQKGSKNQPQLVSTSPNLNEDLIKFSSIEVNIKPGWVYFPKDTTLFLKSHKQIVKPGQITIDNLNFDQHIIYVEYIAISSFLLDSYKGYFNFLQVREKNASLGLKLQCPEILDRFSKCLTKSKKSIIFSSKNKLNFANNKKINLSIFLFKLQKLVSLNTLVFTLKKTSRTLFSDSEIILAKEQLPGFITIGSNLKICSKKIYYIKNINQRYLHFGKKTNVNNYSRTHLNNVSFQKTSNKILNSKLINEKLNISSLNTPAHLEFSEKQSFKLKSLQKEVSLRLNDKSTSFYLSKSFLKRKHFANLKQQTIRRIIFQNKNYLIFQNIQKVEGNTANLAIFNKSNVVDSPTYYVLIRKIKQYSIFKNRSYKKLISKNNQFPIINSYFNKTSTLTNLSWFNKQVTTNLFSSFASADLQITSACRFKNSKQTFLTKEFNIFEFFILVNIPKFFPFKHAKVSLKSKTTLLSVNSCKLKTLLESPSNSNFEKDNIGILKNAISVKSFYNSKISNLDNSLTRKNYRPSSLKKFKLIGYTGILLTSELKLRVILYRELDNSSFMVPTLNKVMSKFTTTNVVVNSQDSVFANNPLSLTDFFSPYQGEITEIKTDSLGKQSCFFITNKDQLTFTTKKTTPLTVVGKLIRYGEQITETLSIPNSGQIIQVDKNQVVLRKAEPILFSSKGVFYVHHGDFVEKNSPLLTLFYQRLKTGDIVQGIPKIEQLFEARQTKEGEILPENLHDKLHDFFEKYKHKYSPQDAARKSLEKTQQLLVDGVQRVYQSQGVTIADKHLEVIVRQMTSKVKIIEGGQSGLLRGELIDLDWIEIVNKGINSQKAEYEPIILGITKAALETESFISAASFQETTRILARAAIERKTDFLRGLKENVILGHLIPAGTGFSLSFNPQSSDYSIKTENSEFFRNLYLGLKTNRV